MVVCAPSLLNAQSCSSGFSMRDLKALADAQKKDHSTAVVPLHPATAQIAARVATTFACQQLINYYADKLGVPNAIVKGTQRVISNALVVEFGNKIHQGDEAVCGALRYEVPIGLPGHDATRTLAAWMNWAISPVRKDFATSAQNAAHQSLSKDIRNDFLNMESLVATEIEALAQPYFPDGRNLPTPKFGDLTAIAHNFQLQITGSYKKTIEQQKWSRLDEENFSSVSICSAVLPTATGPNEKFFEKYPAAFTGYKQIKTMIEGALQQ